MKITLTDISHQKNETLKELRLQKGKLESLCNSLFVAKAPQTMNFLHLFDGVLVGYNLFRRIRRFFFAK